MRKSVLVVSFLSLWVVTALAALEPTHIQPNKPDDQVQYFTQEITLASQGDAAAADCVGDMYQIGFGVAQDAGQQFHWHSVSAEKGSDAGKLDVAWDYAWGLGVQKDSKKGLEVVRELVAKGYVPAQTTLGFLYFSGTGVDVDSKQGISWLKKAADAGDINAQIRLGMIYRNGEFYVDADAKEADGWLDKAAKHETTCAADFESEVGAIIYANVEPGSLLQDRYGPLAISYKYVDGRPQGIKLVTSSGNHLVDEAWLRATQVAKLPQWPVNYQVSDRTLGIWAHGSQGYEPDFKKAIKAAVAFAMVMPKEVLLNGSKGTGKVTVSFDFLDDHVSNVKVTRSSNEPSEDAAALAAVRDASYPMMPHEYFHVKIPMVVTLDFGEVAPTTTTRSAAPVVSTATRVPAPATH